MKVNLIGPIFGTSGYANHVRQLANAIGALVDTKLTTQLPQNWQMAVNDLELQMINKGDSEDRINLIIDLPHNWKQYASKKTNIAWLVWEGDKIPESWLDCIQDESITRVLVPSAHVYNAIKNTIGNQFDLIRNKIKLVPHGVNLNIFLPFNEPKKEIFTFICNKGFRGELDRGGLQHTLKAFIQEFNKGEARMIVKLNPAYSLPPNEVLAIVDKYRLDAGKSNENLPDIFFNIGESPQKELAVIYNSGHIFVSSTEGEAFNLCALEAMACGLPVIATNFGGQTDFVNETNGYLIDYELKEVKHELMYEGIQWAKPNIKQLREKMRECFDKKDRWIQKSVRAHAAAKPYTWENSAKKVIETISEVEAVS